MSFSDASYLIFDILLAAYAGYSWYWQATIDFRARFRMSSIIWALVIVVLGYYWEFIDAGSPGLSVFLALFLLISIIDANSGFTPKRIVLSGYFRRTMKYKDIQQIVLLAPPKEVGDISIAVLRTVKHQTYYLRFNKAASDVSEALLKHIGGHANIDIQQMN